MSLSCIAVSRPSTSYQTTIPILLWTGITILTTVHSHLMGLRLGCGNEHITTTKQAKENCETKDASARK
jgi:hypothetical protein